MGRSARGPSPARLARLPGDRGHRRKHLPLPLLPRRRNVRYLASCGRYLSALQSGAKPFMDIVLAYMFYKLSVLAAELKRNGKANNICAWIQCVLMVILFYKYNNPTKDSYYPFTEFIWGITILVYSCTVFYECIGLKHPRHHLEAMFKIILTTKGGLIKVLKRLYWELIN